MLSPSPCIRGITSRQGQFDADLQLVFDQLVVYLDPAWLQRSKSIGTKTASTSVLTAAVRAQLTSCYAEDFRRLRYSLESAGLEP